MNPGSPTPNRTVVCTVDTQNVHQRLDKFLGNFLKPMGLSRTQVQRLLEDGFVTFLGQKFTNATYKVKADDVFTLTLPEPEESAILPQTMDLCIVYEDDDLLVINKPAGLVVHPAPGHRDSTLVNALLAHCGDSLSGIGGVKRPGIVHRLDKDTSGLMVVAKNDVAHKALSEQFSAHDGVKGLVREYWVLVWGRPHPLNGKIDAAISRHPRNRQKMAVSQSTAAKNAVTYYKTLKTYTFNNADISLLSCILATGRTHQIRVHCHHMGCPVVGDTIYGKKNLPKGTSIDLVHFPRQALHAKKLTFTHPTSKKQMTFETELPEDLKKLLKCFE
jgi:23S rRNA pseudouridine1911/1915/1917 synthase